MAAQGASFMAQLLGLTDAAALSDLAQNVTTSAGAVFVLTKARLGAPH